MPGVLEDVTDIVLNLKHVVFGLSDAPSHWAAHRGHASPGPVTAGMINGHPDLVICNPGPRDLHADRGRKFSRPDVHRHWAAATSTASSTTCPTRSSA